MSTVDGELQVPKHVDHLGWWDGSSWLDDPFGSTVIAGHVDSATEGLGFFAQLLEVRRDDRVQVLGASGQRQTFKVTSVRTVGAERAGRRQQGAGPDRRPPAGPDHLHRRLPARPRLRVEPGGHGHAGRSALTLAADRTHRCRHASVGWPPRLQPGGTTASRSAHGPRPREWDVTVDGSVSEGVVRPLRALWRHHRSSGPGSSPRWRPRRSNTAADVAPELLLGVAVDIVVRGSDSFASSCSASRAGSASWWRWRSST